MSKHYVFFYFFQVSPDRLMEVVPAHREYWDEIGPSHFTGGPFADRDGGMIIFSAGSLEEAEKKARDDPFVTEEIIDRMWVKEWEVATKIVEDGRE
jgi:uncharacterized protein YciI